MKNKFKILSIVLILILISSCMEPAKKLGLTYGAFIRQNGIEFRLYAPSSEDVNLVIFSNAEDESGKEFPMVKNENGDWMLFLENIGVGTLYGYRLTGPYNDENVIIADPYSKAAVTQNTWRHVAKSLVIDDSYQWHGDTWKNIHPRDLVIYEAHVRDMTVHPSSGSKEKGSYLGFIENDQKGGIAHLKSMGVNAVQLLPIWEFANVEIPYLENVDGLYNNWNPYARNHWGYMPTFYMAPESYYASDGTDEPKAWNGKDGRAVREMKDMVKSLHREGMAVILDVVVNHISNYDWHPLKYIDKTVYFKLDENENFLSQCCGNLLATDHQPVRDYVIESLKYWMTDYHIDGFRFDQAHLLSPEMATLIKDELTKINPNVIIYGEAWDEREKEFSKLGWGSFNARFRDLLRGDLHNYNDQGFLFRNFRDGESIEDLQSIIMGTISGKKSVYQSPAHAVNFLEVHDDFCFNDYLRLSSGINTKEDIIQDPMKHIEISPKLLKMNKLGALILLTSQGIPIIHQGQEWAHSQIIAETDANDPNVGKMDRNPYNKDNETNWVNWLEKEQNLDLTNYYSDLIKLRRSITELRHANPKDFKFQGLSEMALGYVIRDRIAVYINGENSNAIETELPEGTWRVIADGEKVNINGIREISGTITLPATSGMVLQRVN
ncbi:MAG: alpha-amylase family glycosyl hydrolase [Fidelibacterota bacterium]